MLRFALVITLLFLITGCSTKGNSSYKKRATLKQTPREEISEPSYKPKNDSWITKALFAEYKKWYRTPYKNGGLDFDGVDCSSLIQNIYKSAFGINLPRTTKEQIKRGYPVDLYASKEGDLIFFKTGYNTRHTGIIIEKGKFIHASSKYGVRVSETSNPYWKEKYLLTRRILAE